MKSKSVVAAVMAVTLSLGNIAFAQPNEGPNARDNMYPGQRHGQTREPRNAQRGQRPGPSAQRGPDARQYDRRGPGAYQNAQRGPGAGPEHNFYRGERLPPQYRHRNYVVDDWRAHHLSPPPRGYHWVQAGPDYVLVAIATGIIAQILLQQQ